MNIQLLNRMSSAAGAGEPRHHGHRRRRCWRRLRCAWPRIFCVFFCCVSYCMICCIMYICYMLIVIVYVPGRASCGAGRGMGWGPARMHCMHVRISMYVCTYVRMCVRVCAHCVCAASVCVCVCVCVSVCVSV